MKANPNLKAKALEESLLKQPWDESVKSLVTVPRVLEMLNEKLDMTQKLGDACPTKRSVKRRAELARPGSGSRQSSIKQRAGGKGKSRGGRILYHDRTR